MIQKTHCCSMVVLKSVRQQTLNLPVCVNALLEKRKNMDVSF